MAKKPIYNVCKLPCSCCGEAPAVTGECESLCVACHARELRIFEMAKRYNLVAWHYGAGDRFIVAAMDSSRSEYRPIFVFDGRAAAVERFLTADIDVHDAEIEVKARELCRAAGYDPDRNPVVVQALRFKAADRITDE